MLPLEFIVVGTPKSLRASSKSRDDWKQRVGSAAAASLPNFPTIVTGAVKVTIIYFYVETGLDVDNILKPILDAMSDLIYVDDNQVSDIIAAKRDLSLEYTLTGVSPVILTQLLSASGDPSDFVFVRVEAAAEGVLP